MAAQFSTVILDEKVLIGKHRENKKRSKDRPQPAESDETSPIDDECGLVGLALSGGGIRAAAFSTGVLAACKELGVIDEIDYLSTVSGGGYIGTAWTWFESRKENLTKQASTHRLDPLFGSRHQGQRTDPDWTDVGDYIRLNGDYLRPKTQLGALSIAAVALRNMVLTAFTGFCVVSSICILPNVVAKIGDALHWRLVVPGLLGSKLLNEMSPAVAAWGSIAVLSAIAFLVGSAGYALYCGMFARGEPDYEPNKRMLFYTSGRIRWQVHFGRALTFSLTALVLFATALLAELAIAVLGKSNDAITIAFTGFGAVVAALGGAIKAASAAGDEALGDNRGDKIALIAWLLAILALGLLTAQLMVSAYGKCWEFQVGLAITTLAICLVVRFSDPNFSGLHRMYRDRLMEAFMPIRNALYNQRWYPATDADIAPLSSFCDEATFGPYHILNSNIVLVNSTNPTFRGRGGDNFVLSPKYCGGDSVGWHLTKKAFNRLTLASAMAISGAAINPHTASAGRGATRSRTVAAALALANVRLGFWVSNPAEEAKDGTRGVDGEKARLTRVERLLLATPSLLGVSLLQLFPQLGYDTHDFLIELTDGGHFDNTGMYELFRRNIPVIVCVDAGADPECSFADLSNALERARLDFGVQIRFLDQYPAEDLVSRREQAAPVVFIGDAAPPPKMSSLSYAKRGHAIATIEYSDGASGILLLIKPCLVKSIPVAVLSNAVNRPGFPHSVTTDQFFDESKFDAYRQLGYYLAKGALMDCGAQKSGLCRGIQSLVSNVSTKSMRPLAS